MNTVKQAPIKQASTSNAQLVLEFKDAIYEVNEDTGIIRVIVPMPEGVTVVSMGAVFNDFEQALIRHGVAGDVSELADLALDAIATKLNTAAVMKAIHNVFTTE